MEAEHTPLIIPIWITGESLPPFLPSPTDALVGFDQVMHESRTWPCLMPRAGKSVSITIGEPINDAVEPLLEQHRTAFPVHWKPDTYAREVGEDLRDEPHEIGRAHV